jgi:hypothetical protein
VDGEHLDSIKEFIKLNTNVTEINTGIYIDFSHEMKFNTHLLRFPGYFPLMIYFLERNLNLKKISTHFHCNFSRNFDVKFQFH